MQGGYYQDFAGPGQDNGRSYSPHPSPQHDPHLHPARTPSPMYPPQHGYQLQDRWETGTPMPMPMGSEFGAGDRLAAQPTYSVENIPNTFGHNEQFEDRQPQMSQMPQPYGGYGPHDYPVSPEEHHDAYYNQPYEPSPVEEHPLGQFPTQQNPFYDDNDSRPILQHSESGYGPDPHQAEEYPDQPTAPLVPPTPNPAPIKRWKTVKEVQLYDGNLVLDCPIAPDLLKNVPHAEPPERDEFTHMRYSAATCDPDDFYNERFTLRQQLFAKKRQTELFIVVTMYNEEPLLLARTLIGVFKNIEYMCNRTHSKTWGKEGWKKIVVCVVSDGRGKIHPGSRALMAALGCYQDGIAKQQVNGKDVTTHIYEYTTQVGLALGRKDTVEIKPRGATRVQMIFCLKEKNQKKINSHRWFFNAFGRVLQPNICVLLDAGTKPGKDSVYHLWKAFDLEPKCGGACGEIKAALGKGWRDVFLNPIVACQNFEYKMSNILDKPLESAFGFISVLPGAFSAYRYQALQNDAAGNGPLQKYFLGEKLHGADAGIFSANMYLAEDRILCFELVAKRKSSWILQYVKSSTGETDVMEDVIGLIGQRRRWLNGSFFAAVYALAHFYQIFRSSHSGMRKLMFLIEFTYQTINQLFAWFAIGNFFLVFRILTTSLGDSDLLGTAGTILGVVFEWMYLAILLTCFVLSLGNIPKQSKKLYTSMVIFWAVIMVYLMFASIFITVKSIETQVAEKQFTVSELFKNKIFFTLIVSLMSTYLLWVISSILFLDPFHLVTSFIQYLLLTPTYINILNVYAFCNIHDISWGTKGDDKAPELGGVTTKPGGKLDVNIPTDDGDLNAQYRQEMVLASKPDEKKVEVLAPEEKQKGYYAGFRSAVVLVWIFSNLALAAVVLSSAGLERLDVKTSDDQRSTIYMAVVLWSVAGLSAFRFIGAMWFLIVRLFRGV